ncbi:Thioredoxin [Streptomyces hygroscopicus subsp. limoneus]|nr:Thioredoxin [Streptomyces hygroscopicus subsp. limoneus]
MPSVERVPPTASTGVVFGAAYARAAAPRESPGISEPDAAEPVQRAWFVDGRSLSDAAVHQDVAVTDELGGDADVVTTASASPARRVKAHADSHELRRPGVTPCPTLLPHTAPHTPHPHRTPHTAPARWAPWPPRPPR